MSDKMLYTVIAYSENIAGLLNQVTVVFTRRQVDTESLNVSASSTKGAHKYIVTARTDKDIIERVVKQTKKKIDVIQTHYPTEDEVYFHEIALCKVFTPAFQENPEASKPTRRYNVRTVEVNPVSSIIEENGMSEDITSLYGELKASNCVLQLVRSGHVTITTSCSERVNEFLDGREVMYNQSRNQ